MQPKSNEQVARYMKRTVAGLLAVSFFTGSLEAQSWSLQFDNDIFFGTDGQYTGGMQIGWMSNELNATQPDSFANGYIGTMSDLLTSLYPFDLAAMRRNGAISIQGAAITPQDTKSKTPVYDDVPYMGVTSATFSFFVWNEHYFHELSFAAGVIGPASGAAFVQKSFHESIGNEPPQGWDNQLGNRLLLQAGYLVGDRKELRRFDDNHVLEWFNNFFADAGTLYVGTGAGTVLRFGHNAPEDFVDISGLFSRSLVKQLNFTSRKSTWGWDVGMGIGINALGYFYLYEASKDLGYEYDRPWAFLTGYFGFNLYYKNIQLSMEGYPSRPLDRYFHSDNFGRLSVVWWSP